MSLKAYHKKRIFDQTPEPKGAEPSNMDSTVLHFLIHKHAASHLHYDLRLEVNGVLKSWAVPKGPSLDPAIKRLAIMVEDHPFEYKDFEGIIPKGNYGAGSVIIWDEGVYVPDCDQSEDHNRVMSTMLESGHVNFYLKGHKLKGLFSLIKLKKSEKNTWLLIKHQDEYSSSWNILKKNKSVRSHATIENVNKIVDLSFKKKILNLVHAKKEPMPEFIKPMLATQIKEAFSRKGWIFEIKWDGYRIISYVNNKQVKLLTRNQKDYTKIFFPIANALADLKLQAIFDGEIVVVDKNGRSDFQLLQQFQKTGEGNLVYYIFDILWLKGYDLTQIPLYQRKQILKEILPVAPNIRLSEHIEEEGIDFFNVAKEHHLEGIIAKAALSQYQSGKRSHDWLKIKSLQQQEAIILGYTAPRGSREYIGALILGVCEDQAANINQIDADKTSKTKEKWVYIGHVGGGLTTFGLADLKQRLDPLVTKISPFLSPPKTNAPVTWVKPKLVCEVSFEDWTREGILRQPIFLGLRTDLSPKQVHREKSMSLSQIKITTVNKSLKENQQTHINSKISKIEKKSRNEKVFANKKDEVIATINHHRLLLTHLNKVFWPKENFTKRDLLSYYYDIAQYILPYIKNRPESLNRHPNGIEGKHFFQKNFEDAPDWLLTCNIRSKSKDKQVNYLLCQNEAALLYIINLGCIEINPWLSSIQHLENPDYCVLDLDPLGIHFKEVIKTALVLHEILDSIGAMNYCKTSGATGLHIYIPLGAKYSYEQSKQFAELICNLAHKELPKTTSMLRLPKHRPGRVYLDFLQNRINQTLVAPYSVRPQPKAPVSTPLFWEEVNPSLYPEKFTINNIRPRLHEIGDIWQPVLKKKINLLNCFKKISGIYG